MRDTNPSQRFYSMMKKGDSVYLTNKVILQQNSLRLNTLIRALPFVFKNNNKTALFVKGTKEHEAVPELFRHS